MLASDDNNIMACIAFIRLCRTRESDQCNYVDCTCPTVSILYRIDSRRAVKEERNRCVSQVWMVFEECKLKDNRVILLINA